MQVVLLPGRSPIFKAIHTICSPSVSNYLNLKSLTSSSKLKSSQTINPALLPLKEGYFLFVLTVQLARNLANAKRVSKLRIMWIIDFMYINRRCHSIVHVEQVETVKLVMHVPIMRLKMSSKIQSKPISCICRMSIISSARRSTFISRIKSLPSHQMRRKSNKKFKARFVFYK